MVPQFIMENPMNKWMIWGGFPIIFGGPPTWCQSFSKLWTPRTLQSLIHQCFFPTMVHDFAAFVPALSGWKWRNHEKALIHNQLMGRLVYYIEWHSVHVIFWQTKQLRARVNIKWPFEAGRLKNHQALAARSSYWLMVLMIFHLISFEKHR